MPEPFVAFVTGADRGLVKELEDYGVIRGEKVQGETMYDDTEREIIRAVTELKRFGVGGRNLRVFRTSADREAALLEQILAPALRIGYLLGPEGPLMNAMVQRTSDDGFSAPLFVQEMASWLLDHHIDAQIRAVNEGYRQKALAVGAAIQERLGPWLEGVTGGSAGFYFYLTFRRLETHPDSPFFTALAQGGSAPRVIYIPGIYCVAGGGEIGVAARRQLRLSYGFEETERILEALDLMRDAAEAL